MIVFINIHSLAKPNQLRDMQYHCRLMQLCPSITFISSYNRVFVIHRHERSRGQTLHLSRFPADFDIYHCSEEISIYLNYALCLIKDQIRKMYVAQLLSPILLRLTYGEKLHLKLQISYISLTHGS